MYVHGIAGLLIALAAGYWVLIAASGQTGRVRTLGRGLALAIMVVSALAIVCKISCWARFGMGPNPLSSAKAVCPFGGK
jgi:hypothetical protein